MADPTMDSGGGPQESQDSKPMEDVPSLMGLKDFDMEGLLAGLMRVGPSRSSQSNVDPRASMALRLLAEAMGAVEPYLALADQTIPDVANLLGEVLARGIAFANETLENESFVQQLSRMTTRNAENVHRDYQALVDAGFNEGQAMQILLHQMTQSSNVINSLNALTGALNNANASALKSLRSRNS